MKKKEESIEQREDQLNRTGKEKLLEEIEKNAREEARSIIEKAETAARQKVESAEGKAERTVREAEERAEKRAEQIRKNTDQSVDIHRKRVRLQQNEEIIELVFQAVRKKINDRIHDEEYPRVIEDWAVEAVLGLDTEKAVIAVSPEEKKYITDSFISGVEERVHDISGKKVQITISHEEEDDYGVVARSADGRLEYRNQIETRLYRNRSYYRKLIYRKLEIEGTE